MTPWTSFCDSSVATTAVSRGQECTAGGRSNKEFTSVNQKHLHSHQIWPCWLALLQDSRCFYSEGEMTCVILTCTFLYACAATTWSINYWIKTSKVILAPNRICARSQQPPPTATNHVKSLLYSLNFFKRERLRVKMRVLLTATVDRYSASWLASAKRLRPRETGPARDNAALAGTCGAARAAFRPSRGSS